MSQLAPDLWLCDGVVRDLGGRVGEWRDSSGNGNHFVVRPDQPSDQWPRFVPVVCFDGEEQER
jgi:hypothetical protein